MLIREHGEPQTADIIKGWVSNLAAPPFSNDTKVMQAIIAGQGDVGIVNSYYFGRLFKKDPTIPIALYWPNQSSNGVHVNVSGAGMVTFSQNKPDAVAFLEWLSTGKAQQVFADVNMEYPVNPDVPVIIVTSDIMRDTLSDAVDVGIQGYFLKPFDSQLLVEKIRAVLQESRSPNKGPNYLTPGSADWVEYVGSQ